MRDDLTIEEAVMRLKSCWNDFIRAFVNDLANAPFWKPFCFGLFLSAIALFLDFLLN